MDDHKGEEPGGRSRAKTRGNVFNFRRLKWGDPQSRLQVLPASREPVPPPREPLPRLLRIINLLLLGVIVVSGLVMVLYFIDYFVD